MSDTDTLSRETFAADFPRELLTFFYPVHYKLGMEMEKAMGRGVLDRKQSAMLWLVFVKRNAEGWVPRKEIVRELSGWFEISEAKVTRMLQSLSAEPPGLLTNVESPDSSREKVLALTPAGDEFVQAMMAEAAEFMRQSLSHLSIAELEEGMRFFQKAFAPGRVPD